MSTNFPTNIIIMDANSSFEHIHWSYEKYQRCFL
jgi:hypothetical protein